MAVNSRIVIRFAHINVRSLLTGFQELVQIIHDENFDVVAITESWLTPDILDEAVNIPGYHFIRNDRLSRGGGTGIYVINNLKYEIIDSIDNSPNANLEQLWIKLHLKNTIIAVGTIYRPPAGNLQLCIDQLDTVLSTILPTVDDVICIGDVNVNLLNLNNPITDTFNAYNFSQLINEPTRITNITSSLLDPVFVTNPEKICKSGLINCDMISDHHLVFCDLVLMKSKSISKIIKFRDFKNFNNDSFLQDLNNLPWHTIIESNDIDNKVVLFNDLIINLFNIHAPIRVVKATKSKAPWLTDTLKLLMKYRDNALSKFKLTKSNVDWEYYKQLRNYTLAAVRAEKKAYINSVAMKNNVNSKETWKVLKSLNLKSQSYNNIPAHLSNPEDINNYFISVHKLEHDCSESINYYNSNILNEEQSFSFQLATTEEVHNAIFKIKSDAYGIDNISIKMIKYCCPFIEKYITHIVNCCIEKNYFPSNWKCALVTPLQKNSNPQTFSDLRPISILPAISKILEKILYNQIYNYFNQQSLFSPYQSGFRPAFSTVSALAQVTDDIIRACDESKVTGMVLLDYSKAFDKINHDLFCAKLNYYGFNNPAIQFVKSYLYNRRQIVTFSNNWSSAAFIPTGVPQGSILGPLFFLIYTTDILQKISINYHAYADDVGLYFSFNKNEANMAVQKMNENLNIISNMSKNHNLSLNPSKCAAIFFGSKCNVTVKNEMQFKIDDATIPTVDSYKYLGVILDSQMKFKLHVNSICQKTYCSMKLLYSNRRIINFNIRKQLCDTLVLSHVNYCSLVYWNCLDVIHKSRLQKIQNTCCRFVFNLRKYDSVSHKINILNWLNINNRIKLQQLVFTHKVITYSTPEYLKEKFIPRNKIHPINIRHKDLLSIPKFKSALFKKSFTYTSVLHYNILPNNYKQLKINSFKKTIRTDLLRNQ